MAINSMSSVSHGLSGLASGMDTQSMVDAMLSGTQAKIDKQKAQKTILGYKQVAYRQMYTGLNSLATSFFSASSPSATRIMYSEFYNTMTAATKSSNFRVTGTTQAATGKTTINSISQLAKSAKLTSGEAVSGEVKGELDLRNLEGLEVQVQLDGVSKTIKLPGFDGTAVTADEFRTQLQASITRELGSGITVGGTGNQITFAAEGGDTSREFAITGKATAMQALGIVTGSSNKVNKGMRLEQTNFKTDLSGDDFKFEINGTKFEFSGSDTVNTVISKINSSNANVKVRYSALEDKFVMESTVSGKDVDIKIKQTSGNLMTAMFGADNGSSITGGKQMVADMVNGKLPGVTYDHQPGDIISADDAILINDAIGALEGEINRLTKDKDYTMWLRVNGADVEITIPKRVADPNDPNAPIKEYKLDDVVDLINNTQGFKDEGGRVQLAADANNQLTGGVVLAANPGVELEIGAGFKEILGITATTNMREATDTDTLASLGMSAGLTFTIKGVDYTIDANKTMAQAAQELENHLKTAYAGETNVADIKVDFGADPADEKSKGRFRIFGVDIPMDFTIAGDDKKLFGSDKIQLNTQAGAAGVQEAGQNAKLKINGVDVERNSNEFTIDGLNYELVNTFNETNAADKVETIEVTRDTTKIFDGLSKFMEEYNKLVDQTWGKLKEDPTYRDYAPLTDKQKESMSDKEVELWEKKSQEGLLRGDPTMSGIMDAMRRVLVSKPEGAKYSLAQIGIDVAYDMEKGIGGYLKFGDTAGIGEKLKEVIAQEPEEIAKLMSGICVELNKVIKGVSADTTGMKPGDKEVPYSNLSLANLAGRPGMPDTASSIYRQIKDINNNLEALNRKYKAEYDRYWKQYNSMEQMISNMNQQSSWLSQQFA